MINSNTATTNIPEPVWTISSSDTINVQNMEPRLDTLRQTSDGETLFLQDSTPMETFDLSDNFGYRYFEDEEEKSLEFLENYKNLYTWFRSLTGESKDQVKKQWREMLVHADAEYMVREFFGDLYPTTSQTIDLRNEAKNEGVIIG